MTKGEKLIGRLSTRDIILPQRVLLVTKPHNHATRATHYFIHWSLRKFSSNSKTRIKEKKSPIKFLAFD